MTKMQNGSADTFSINVFGKRIGFFILFCAAYALVEWLSSFHFSSFLIPFHLHLSSVLVRLFEHHLSEFVVGMIAIAIFSRGNLWSYGINALNIRQSMYVLWRFYLAALIIIAVVVVVPLFQGEKIPAYLAGANFSTMIGWIVFEWLATAVADEIFFHGFCQTLLTKYWRNAIVINVTRRIEIPFSVIASTVLFTVGRSNTFVYGGSGVEYFFAALIGFYTGMVYYRTRSLLTPMLSLAFFYGMPFLVRYVWMVWK
jgi:membrane protease YdiL (CAAX protease family)